MAIRVFDCWYHDQDIREALDRPGFLEGESPTCRSARIPTKALGYVVGKKAGAPPGSTVVFVVEGSPPIVAAISVPPEGRAVLLDDAPADPSARITIDRRTFARLAGGRWTGAHAARARRRARRRRHRARRPRRRQHGVHDLARRTLRTTQERGWTHDE